MPVRKMHAGDTARIPEYIRAKGHTETIALSLGRLMEWLRSKHDLCFVATHDERLTGYALVQVHVPSATAQLYSLMGDDDQTLEVLIKAVDEKLREKSIRRLIHYSGIEPDLKSAGFEWILTARVWHHEVTEST